MFARLVSGQTKVEKLDKVIKIWKEKDTPQMKSVKGYRGSYLLTDRKTGQVISITFWDSEMDAIADEQSTLHQQQVSLYQDIIPGEYSHQRYEISARDKM